MLLHPHYLPCPLHRPFDSFPFLPSPTPTLSYLSSFLSFPFSLYLLSSYSYSPFTPLYSFHSFIFLLSLFVFFPFAFSSLSSSLLFYPSFLSFLSFLLPSSPLPTPSSFFHPYLPLLSLLPLPISLFVLRLHHRVSVSQFTLNGHKK